MTQEALNIAGQCRATASSPLAKNILVDGGSGLLTELLLDAARVIEALAQPAPVQEPVAWPMQEQPDGSIIPVDPSELPSDYFTTPPAAPVQPVAWAVVGEGEWGKWDIGNQFETGNPPNHKYWSDRGYELAPLYTTPPAAQPTQQEPVAVISSKQLSAMFQNLKGIDTSQSGYHWRVGWNAALRQAMDYSMPSYTTPPAAPVQEPVPDEDELSNGFALALHDAVLIRIGNDDEATRQAIARIDKLVAKYTQPAPVQEPVGEVGWAANVPNTISVVHWKNDSPPIGTKLYTHPPQRQWVGLTASDRKEIERQSVYVDGAIRMTEAKLKERNHG